MTARRRGVLVVLVIVLLAGLWAGQKALGRWLLSEARQEIQRGRRPATPVRARGDGERRDVLLALAREARSWSEEELAVVLERGAERGASPEEIAHAALGRSLGDRHVVRDRVLAPLAAQVPDVAEALAGPLLAAVRDPNADPRVCRDLLLALSVLPDAALSAAIDAHGLDERDRAGLRRALETRDEAFPDVHPVALLREEHLRVDARYDSHVPLPRVRVASRRRVPERAERGDYDKPMPAHTDRPRRFEVDARDAATGERLTPSGLALLRDGAPRELATGSGRTLHSDVEPLAGDRVLVHVMGRDPVVVPWEGEASLPVPVGPASTGEIVVRLDPADREDHGFALVVRHGMGAAVGLADDAVFAWQQRFAAPGETLRIRCPADARHWLRFEHPGELPLVPAEAWAQPGDEIVVRLAPVRDVHVGDAAGDGPEDAYATFAVDAAEAVDEHVAATVQRWSPFGHLEIVRDERGWVLADVPAIGLHVFFRAAGAPRYLHVPADRLPAGPPGPPKAVAGRPRVAGLPVPEMTILAPGRLDLDTARSVGCRPLRVRGYALAVHDLLDWRTATLPDAEWLTAYHPTFGIAHLRWSADRVPEGDPEPGAIVLRVPQGGTLSGAVRVRPVWRSRQRTRWGGSHNPLHIDLDGREELVLGGLPLGAYAVQVDVLTGPPGEESATLRERLDVDLTPGAPHHVREIR